MDPFHRLRRLPWELKIELNVSPLFSTRAYEVIQTKVKDLIHSQEVFLTGATSNSPRAVGDAIQEIIEENFQAILGDWCREYSSHFARRSMEDLAFRDYLGNYYAVDVKTHRMDTKFNMPNLTSVERLASFYGDDSNYFTLLNIHYRVEGTHLTVEDVQFVPIEFLDWSCLTIGALGWGQIQIKNSNKVIIRPQPRAEWMNEFCQRMLAFYNKEMKKIASRMEFFQNVQAGWESRQLARSLPRT